MHDWNPKTPSRSKIPPRLQTKGLCRLAVHSVVTEKATCHYLIYLLDALKLRTSGFKPRWQWHCWLQVFLGCTRFKAKDSLKTLGEMKLLIVTAFDCFEATLNLFFWRILSKRACLCQSCAILNRRKSFSNFKRQSWFIFVSWFVPTLWRYSFFPSFISPRVSETWEWKDEYHPKQKQKKRFATH